MRNPLILSSVHALETAFPKGERSPVAIRSALPRSSLAVLPIVQKRFCGDPCKQQASTLRRAAKLLEGLPDDQAIRILRQIS
jgi:hypothetical protein